MNPHDMINEIDTTIYRWATTGTIDGSTIAIAMEMSRIQGGLEVISMDDKEWPDFTDRMWKRYLTLKARLTGTDAISQLFDTGQELFDGVKDSLDQLTNIKED